jgi:hypothetical protein
MVQTDDNFSEHELTGLDTYLKEKETNVSILRRTGKKLCILRKVFTKLPMTL